jgi:membrane protein required for colicin V production
MNWLDIIIIIVVAISIFMGLKAGIIKVLFMLAGGIIGVVLAGRFSDSLADKLSFISDSNIAGIVAFVIILLAVMIIAMILAMVIHKIVSAVLLGWVDHLGGAVLGLILGAIFCGAALAMWVRYQGISDAVTGSALANFLLDKFPVVLGLLPSEFKSIRDFFH